MGEHTFVRDDGTEYAVPLYKTRPGQSLDALAKKLGGRIPERGERWELVGQGRAFAAVREPGLGGEPYPVVKD